MGRLLAHCVILSAAKNLGCYADLCNQALGKLLQIRDQGGHLAQMDLNSVVLR